MDHILTLDAPATPSEAALRADMDASDRDMAEGHTVPFTEVMQDLEAALARIESRCRAPTA